MSDGMQEILSRYEPVIGLEVHVQLSTQSKIFCGCSASFGASPNTHTCPICLGLPGALPVFNERVAEMAAALGMALGCDIRTRSVFARKNYFYADLPKGYQITQFEEPICEHGGLRFHLEDGSVAETQLVRIHMEEDAGKSVHDGGGGYSRVDLNRAGVPLLEVVSCPDLHRPEEAAGYLKALRAIVRSLGISDGNMQEGSLRCDANVSLRLRGQEALGTRAEVKNLNSFRYVARAIRYEIRRQAERLDEGETVAQETRLYDPARDETRSMRSKEEANDYRYFPDPDLLPLWLESDLLQRAKARLCELPFDRVERYREDLGLSFEDARLLGMDAELAAFFEAALQAFGRPAASLAKWVVGDLMKELSERSCVLSELGLPAARLAALVRLVEAGAISASAGKQVLGAMIDRDEEPEALVDTLGLRQVSDAGELAAQVAKILETFPEQVATFRGGKQGILGFLMGQLMKATGGKANPKLGSTLMREALAADASDASDAATQQGSEEE